jgi:ribosomal-protein-alanine N-acetyltransferase
VIGVGVVSTPQKCLESCSLLLFQEPEFICVTRAEVTWTNSLAWSLRASTPEAYASYLQYARRKSVCACLICRTGDLRIIGVCNLSQIFLGNLKSAFLGYWIGAKFAGQGYMTEALGLVLSYAFEDLRLHRIEANVQPDNLNSKALVARLGFRLEGFSPRYLKVAGRWKDHERWAICCEEWAEKRLEQSLYQEPN